MIRIACPAKVGKISESSPELALLMGAEIETESNAAVLDMSVTLSRKVAIEGQLKLLKISSLG